MNGTEKVISEEENWMKVNKRVKDEEMIVINTIIVSKGYMYTGVEEGEGEPTGREREFKASSTD